MISVLGSSVTVVVVVPGLWRVGGGARVGCCCCWGTTWVADGGGGGGGEASRPRVSVEEKDIAVGSWKATVFWRLLWSWGKRVRLTEGVGKPPAPIAVDWW